MSRLLSKCKPIAPPCPEAIPSENFLPKERSLAKRAGRKAIVGAWRSLVARYTGGVEVAGSNPVAPTIFFSFPKTSHRLRRKAVEKRGNPLAAFGRCSRASISRAPEPILHALISPPG